MIVERIDSNTNKVVRDYERTQFAVRGMLSMMLEQEDPTKPSVWRGFANNVNLEFVSFMTHAMDFMSHAIRNMSAQAVTDSVGGEFEHQAKLDAFVTESVSEFDHRLYGMTRNDAESAVRVLRSYALQVDILSSSASLSPKVAAIRTREGRVQKMAMQQTDRIGRRMNSLIAVRYLVRHTLVTAYIESYLYTMGMRGEDVAVTVPRDGNPQRFSISGLTPDLPTYQEIKGSVWHPNSNTLVARA